MSGRGTLLAKMGFQDTDRKDPMHDAACAYIASNAKHVYLRLIGQRPHSVRVVQEHIVSKGYGQYQTTVGFLDLLVSARVWEKAYEYHRDGIDSGVWELCESSGLMVTFRNIAGDSRAAWTHSEASAVGPTLGIEVKWTESCVSDAIRQMAVYKTFCEGVKHWALATPRLLNAEQKSALDSNGFKYIRLDEAKVRAFADQQRSTAATSEMVL